MSKLISSKKPLIKNLFTFKKSIVFILVIILIFFAYPFIIKNDKKPTYQTEKAENRSLIVSVSGTGVISSGNNVQITTSVSGLVKNVYVKNGDIVSQGEKIAEIELDKESNQKMASAWASYLGALNSLKNAQASKMSADAQMWQEHKAQLDAENTLNYKNGNSVNQSTKKDYTDLEKLSVDSAKTQADKSWQASEFKYKEADAAVNSAQAQLNSAWLAYEQTTSSITAPTSGTISNMVVVPGTFITQSSSSSNSTTTSQIIGAIHVGNNNTQATITITEIDAPHILPKQKATMTIDAFPNKTFTGSVLTINTSGQTSSGVTTYPTTILFDAPLDNMYPNMAVTAKIITEMKSDIITIPSSAIQNNNGENTVKIIEDGKTEPMSVIVETGISNDTQTEIISGLKEGDNIVTGTINQQRTKTGTKTSVFGGMSGTRGGMTGGNIRSN